MFESEEGAAAAVEAFAASSDLEAAHRSDLSTAAAAAAVPLRRLPRRLVHFPVDQAAARGERH